MKVSYNWLQQHIAEKLPEAHALADVITFHAFEVEEVVEINDDVVFDINVLPDRAGDCLSHVGVAREIAGLLGLTLKKETYTYPTETLALPIELQSDLTRRYIAIQINDVTVGPSPKWLKDKLEILGQRSINNIVDATNFVILDSGQPVHAFDRAKIDGGIVVRLAKPGEQITTLSGEEKVLSEKNLVIADYLGPLALAGVKGGKVAEVTEVTKNIVLEIANFDAVSVRKTSRSLNIITDASKRFENNFSPELARNAAAQIVGLIIDIAGGVVDGITDAYPAPVTERKLAFTVKDISRLLGPVSADEITGVLKRYDYTFTQTDDTFDLTVPVWRNDIAGAHDMAEEIGRVLGYERIAPLPIPFTPIIEAHDTYTKIRAAKSYLIHQGYSEVLTYSFRKKGEFYVSYGAKDKSALRTNLSEGVKESFELNRLNAPLIGVKIIKIFEIGTVFTKEGERIMVATCDGGVVQELPLDEFCTQHQITPNATDMQLEKIEKQFVPWSVYPFIARDIAVWVDNSVDKNSGKEQLEKILSVFAKKYCIRDPYLIDEFLKDGRQSLAYRLIFQDKTRTLTEAEVKEKWDLLLDEVAKAGGFEIR